MLHETVYDLRGAGVVMGRWPVGVWRAPDGCKAVIEAQAGSAPEDAQVIVPAVAGILWALCPWVRSYVVPHLSEIVAGGQRKHQGGLFLTGSDGQDYIFVAMASSDFMVNTAYHEAFHALWSHLTAAERDMLIHGTRRGPAWPTEYLRDHEERLARAFADWVMFRLECPPQDGWQPQSAVERIFSLIESGEVSSRPSVKEAMRRRWGTPN